MKLATTYDEGAGGRYRWYDRNRETGKVEAGCVASGFRTEQDAVRHRTEYVRALQRPAAWYRDPVLCAILAFAAGVLVCYLVL